MSENDPQNQSQGEPDLGDAGKRAIKAERDRADAAEREVSALKSQLQPYIDAGLTDPVATKAELDRLASENAALTQDVTEKTVEITRLNVGIDKGLPKQFIARLKGADEAELSADADTLLPLISGKSDPFPKADPSQGSKGATGKTSTADQFASQMEAAGF